MEQNFEIISKKLAFEGIPLWFKIVALVVFACILLYGIIQAIRYYNTDSFGLYFTLFLFGLLCTVVAVDNVVNHCEIYEYVIRVKDNADIKEILDTHFDKYVLIDEQDKVWTFYYIWRLR